jgi:hypothetical protein
MHDLPYGPESFGRIRRPNWPINSIDETAPPLLQDKHISKWRVAGLGFGIGGVVYLHTWKQPKLRFNTHIGDQKEETSGAAMAC